MTTRIVLGILGLISYGAFAQNVIHVRPQHQVEQIYSLSEGEHFYRDESKLDFQFDGVNYSFRTVLKGKQYFHEKGKRKKQLKANGPIWYYPNRYKNCSVVRKDNLLTVKHSKSGKSYGPFEWGKFVYDQKMKPTRSNWDYITSSDLYAFYYYTLNKTDTAESDGWKRNYYMAIPGDEPIGPFEYLEIHEASKNDLSYSYRIDDDRYLQENDVVHGPYEDIIYVKGNKENPNPRSKNSMFFYKKKNTWYCSHPDLKDYSFSTRPHYAVGNYSAKIIELDNQKHQIYSNGEILKSTHEQFYSMNSRLDELEFSQVSMPNQNGFPIQYKVSYHDSLLGVFQTTNEVQFFNSFMFNKDLFPLGLISCDTTENGDLKDGGVYFYSPTEGWIGPYKNKQMSYLYFTAKTTVAYNTKDSTLQFQDGQLYDKVVAADFTSSAKDWWMLRREGYYDQPYKNGVKYTGNKLPSTFLRYRTPDKDYVIVFKEEEQFVKSKYSNKLIGPVSRYSEIAVSVDGINYAEGLRSGNIILINNRAISEGFNLVYNDRLDAFHWINIDEQGRVFLHTYELN